MKYIAPLLLALVISFSGHAQNGSSLKQAYIEQYKAHMDSLPLEDCKYCDGLGVRVWKEADANGQEQSVTKQCNACEGTLKVSSFATHYHMDYDLVVEFQQFLQNCGGFRIC